MMTAFITLIRYEVLQASRSPMAFIDPILFFILVSLLFSLSLGANLTLLNQIGSGLIWVCVLLAQLLSLQTLFQTDYEDGTLTQWILSPTPFILIVYAKIVSHWIISSVPLLIGMPLWLWLFNLPTHALWGFELLLLLSTLTLSVLGSMGAALTLQQGRNTILQGLLILPWCVPVLILASTASTALCTHQTSWVGYTLWLSTMTALIITLLPVLTAQALSIMQANR